MMLNTTMYCTVHYRIPVKVFWTLSLLVLFLISSSSSSKLEEGEVERKEEEGVEEKEEEEKWRRRRRKDIKDRLGTLKKKEEEGRTLKRGLVARCKRRAINLSHFNLPTVVSEPNFMQWNTLENPVF